jgi:hypothetical protein
LRAKIRGLTTDTGDEIQSYPLGDTTLGLLHAAPMNSGGSYGSHIWEP